MSPINVPSGKIVCLYGPTASNKSDIAISLAHKIGGIIINADSQQIYNELPILTSQPSKKSHNLAVHKLYGNISFNVRLSVYKWLELIVNEIERAIEANIIPILVGGTGLYFFCLINGIAKIPNITECTKKKVQTIICGKPNTEIHRLLQKYDANLAKKLNINDRMRIIRGLEIFVETGKRMSEWQKLNQLFFAKEKFLNIYSCPKREIVYSNIESRLFKMLNIGVIDEVENVLKKYSLKDLPKIIGLKTISNYLMGKTTYDNMINEIQKLTNNYAKKQYTWFNNKFAHHYIIENYSSIM